MPDDLPLLTDAWRHISGTPLAAVRRLGGRGRRVYECTGGNGRRAIARVGDVARLRTEEAVIAHVTEHGIPVPKVLFRDGSVMLQDVAGGRPLSEEPAPATAARAGEVLGRLHSLRTNGFGRVDADLNGPADSFAAWFIDDIRAEVEAAQRIAPESVDLIDRAMRVIEAHRADLDRATPGLAHGDYSPHNILVRDGKIAGVIDWEAAKSGPPALDIGWWDLFATAELPTEALLSGYPAIDAETLAWQRRLVVLRVTLSQFSWCTKANDPDGVAAAGRRLSDLITRGPAR